MKTNLFVFSAILLLGMALSTQTAHARAKISATSAALIARADTKPQDKRVEILTAFLEQYNSPMVDSAATFIEEADRNNLDWKFVVSIAGVESWFGQKIPYQSNNAWGWGVYGDNVTYFASWDEGIQIISKSLRTKYMNKWGARNVSEIGSYYAADPKWAYKVTNFMTKLETFEKNYNKKQLSISI